MSAPGPMRVTAVALPIHWGPNPPVSPSLFTTTALLPGCCLCLIHPIQTERDVYDLIAGNIHTTIGAIQPLGESIGRPFGRMLLVFRPSKCPIALREGMAKIHISWVVCPRRLFFFFIILTLKLHISTAFSDITLPLPKHFSAEIDRMKLADLLPLIRSYLTD